MGKQAAVATPPPRWRLRVHAEGAQGLKAASGLMTFDAKPDPYAVFLLNGVSKACEPVHDVEPVKYFAWPKAVVEFDVSDEVTLLKAVLSVHVKDRDTLKDRYIGGASIPLAPLLVGRRSGDGALCSGRLFVLEFEDENFKKRKNSGEIKLTMTVVDTMKQAAVIAAVAAVEKPVLGKELAKKSEDDMVIALVAARSPTVPVIEETSPTPLVTQPVAVVASASVTDTTEQVIASSGQGTELAVSPPTKGGDNESHVEPRKASALMRVATLKVELVSARNLTRPTSVGALFDRKPDPTVTIKLYGLVKSSVALKDVDLTKSVEWANVYLSFELPDKRPPSNPRKGCSSMDLVVHVKDENLMKATYMGGGKMDMSEFFEARSEETAWTWIAPSCVVEQPLERIVMLTYSDEKLSKKKACGEITLRFHFMGEPLLSLPSLQEGKATPTSASPEMPPPVEEPILSESAVAKEIAQEIAQEIPSSNISPVTAAKDRFSGDIKMLWIEVLSGHGLLKPSAGNLAKSMIKSLFDRRPDPYATLVLGSQTRKCPAVNDVDVAFFEWQKAVQVFEFTSKPYPDRLDVHIRDEDVAGTDPYMGGARIFMDEIWNEAFMGASSDPPGDPQLVKSYPLTFMDEKMTKQKECGTVTLRFRWIYADVKLPVVNTQEAPSAADVNESMEKLKPLPTMNPRMGFIYLRKMALYNNTDLLDASLDLYIEASCPSINKAGSAKSDSKEPHNVATKSSVLTDAMKGKGDAPNAKVEWIGDELVIPICVPVDTSNPDFADLRIDLKDKNAIMKDAEIASSCARLKDHGVDFAATQATTIIIELNGAAKTYKTSKTTTVKFEVEVQFLPHDSPLLAAVSPEKHGGIVTLFLLRSVFMPSPSPSAKDLLISNSTVSLEINCLATRKTGLLLFGKSTTAEFHSLDLHMGEMYEDGQAAVSWWSTCSFPVSNKQAITAKENESFDIELAVQTKSGKQNKIIGSLQFNSYSAAFTPTLNVQAELIEFGPLGSMKLEFCAAFRSLVDGNNSTVAKKIAKTVAPPMPSGYLHLLILHAKNLVSPGTTSENAEDLDPEVRVSVEPKYIKRKEYPVRSMLKTKPLENAGAIPSWNEYLRLEYQLPLSPAPPPQPANATQPQETGVKYPPPIVQIGVYDIQMPGEKNGSQVIGKTELPLSAFLLSASPSGDTGVTQQEPIPMTLDVFLANKKTGILTIEGVFEPATSELNVSAEDAVESYRQHCRTLGRQLREKSKKLKSGDIAPSTAELLTGHTKKRGVAGRVELHLIGFRGGRDFVSHDDRGLAAHLWLSSCVEDRREMKSNVRVSEENASGCQVEWDSRLTFFTSDLTTELLRSEVVTLSGKTVGSLKLPLGGLLDRGRGGQTLREWYLLADAASNSKSKDAAATAQEVLLELTFFVDQIIFDPLATTIDTVAPDSTAIVVVNFRQLVLVDVGAVAGMEAACKCTLLGDTPSMLSNKTQIPAERTSFTLCESFGEINSSCVAKAKWGERIKLDVGGSRAGFLARSFALGTLPALRLEVLTKRPGARFQDALATTTLSLVSTLPFDGRKISRWLRFYVGDDNDSKCARLTGLLEVEIAVFCSASALFSGLKEEKLLAQAFDDMECMKTVPGVLCLRFLSGRNLIDVDANGEQDPYVIAKITPRSFSSSSMPSACQTAVSLDGGRHPTWSTGIFELRTEDLLTDYVRFEVVDSNEEDHLPDAYIGGIDIALASLFRDSLANPTDALQLQKTRWLEAWVPIYPVSSKSTQNRQLSETAGEIRVEFRFLSEKYYESASRDQTDTVAGSSPFSNTDLLAKPVGGTLCVHIVQAFSLQCAKGMQPGARVSIGGTNGSHLTKAGKESIVDPMWENEVVEFAWPPDELPRDFAASAIKVEVVDLAVRTANTNALPVIAFETIDVSAFLTHQLARSYHIYPLNGRQALGDDVISPSILIGCQFVPEGREKEGAASLQQQEKRARRLNGSLHCRGVQIKLDLPAYLDSVPLCSPLALRFKCASKGSTQASEVKTINIPEFSLAELVSRQGNLKLSRETSAMLFKCGSEQMAGNSSITCNPIFVGELITSGTSKTDVIAVFKVPIFDFMLFDGHLGSAWYSLALVDDDSIRLGGIKLEVQFLPVLDAQPDAANASTDAARAETAVLGIEISHVAGAINVTCCVVAVELFGCRVETKPNIADSKKPSAVELRWNEMLEIPLPMTDIKTKQSSAVLKIELRDAANAKIVHGSCNWVVPRQVFADNGTLSNDSSDVVVPLEPTSVLDKHGKAKASSSELTFRLVSVFGGKRQVVASDPRRRKGLLYVGLGDEGDAGPQAVQAALVPAFKLKNLEIMEKSRTTGDGILWTELSKSERIVVSVYDDPSEANPSLAIVVKDPKSVVDGTVAAQVAILDNAALTSVVESPSLETFHHLSVLPGKSRLVCKLTYVEALQGQLQLQLSSASWSNSKSGRDLTSGAFHVEARHLDGASQRWVSSPAGNWSRKSSIITWQAGKNELSIGYTNAEEVAEPAVQLILTQDIENTQPKTEAFGRMAIFGAITSADASWKSATVELISLGEAKGETVVLSFQIRFVREKFSFEAVQAKLAAEHEKKSLELAEGTAALKKAFALLGGDMQTPVKISDFKIHVLEIASKQETSDLGALHALDVLQHAADVEADGDLNQLFAMMDVNGDGQISWDEYADHMQSIHALADAGATRALQKQAERASSTAKAQSKDPDEVNEEENMDVHKDTQGQGSKEEEEEEEEEGAKNDSDLEDDDLSGIPAMPMRTDSDIPIVRDVYEVPTPAGEPTKEMAHKATRRVLKPVASNTAAVEKAPIRAIETQVSSRNANRTSVQPNQKSQQVPQADREESNRRESETSRAPMKKLPLLSTFVLDWKVDEVIQWMEHEMELPQYADAIQQNAVNGKLLLTLREEELESELGVTAVLHKRKVMNQIHEFQERFQYPPPEATLIERKRPTSAKKTLPASVVTASIASETPAFIKREQLVYQEKQRAKQKELPYQPRTLGQSRVFPSKTALLPGTVSSTRQPTASSGFSTTAMTNNSHDNGGETFDDAMQDIFEVIHPDSPEKASVDIKTTTAEDSNIPLPRLHVIRIGSESSTDELFEIVRHRIHQLSQQLLPMAKADKETWSDFGDDPDDDDDEQDEPLCGEQTELHLVYNAFRLSRRSSSTDRISRLKFQEGLADLLSIEVSWHQFDLLFRRLDVDGDSELSWDEFRYVFTRQHISFERDDLLILQDALVNFAMDRLDSQQWTLSDLFKAFDRDGGGSVSIAEFATLVRFLFTSSTQVKRHQQQTQHKITKRHVYLLMSCLDASADRRINHQEFLRFFFVVWSNKLLEVQDQLLEIDASPYQQQEELISSLKGAKRKLRRALRTNFSRPFRDAMRCLDVSVPGPFTNLLSRLQLHPIGTSESAGTATFTSPQATQGERRSDGSLQVWQVLRGQTSSSHRNPQSMTQLQASSQRKAIDESRKRVQKGKNEVQRTRLTRQREPNRENAVLQTPARHVALDAEAKLKYDFRP